MQNKYNKINNNNRREFLKKTVALGGLAALGNNLSLMGAESSSHHFSAEKMTITSADGKTEYKPLDELKITNIPESTIVVYDGQGHEYIKDQVSDSFCFEIGGALGNQFIVLLDNKNELIDIASFQVSCQTEIYDDTEIYGDLLRILHWTMTSCCNSFNKAWINNKFYHFFVCWLRDHVHTLKGMKYFSSELKSGIDLYADFQREDGMIWDNIHPSSKEKNWWEKRFSYGNFYRKIENGKYELKRIPVENDVEYLFIEGIYFTWKASGDNKWMASLLDKALKAIDYSTHSEYRWSEKYKLLKRGYTIDTWDFQINDDTEISDDDIMAVHLGKTRFGVMFGDNTGMAAACNYLAEMLEFAGRKNEAEEIQNLGNLLKERIDKLAWNNEYYTHHIPEDKSIKRDLGVDEKSQVSLSNAYSLNRELTQEQKIAIIETYLRIREEMPKTSPGEWYTIYPPFEKGFGSFDSTSKWDYMNGGVTPIVAGELAHGAFENGFEEYGADILKRITMLAQETDNYLHCTYRGAMPKIPKRNFTPVNLINVANTIYPSQNATRNGKWLGHNSTNGIKTFHEIPFEILNQNETPNTGIELSMQENKTPQATININKKAASVYFLHSRENGPIAGTVTLKFDDETEFTDNITADKVGFWWSEGDPENCKLAWRSDNEGHYIGLFVYGMNNPFPEKHIKTIELKANNSVKTWNIAALTLCDKPVFYMPSPVSYGIPDNWGAGAIVYGLVEGLAGVKDIGVAFNTALIAPRWEAAGTREAKVTVKYEASDGYVSYRYKKDETNNRLSLSFTGSYKNANIEILLPEGRKPVSVQQNTKPIDYVIKKVRGSQYVTFETSGVAVNHIQIELI